MFFQPYTVVNERNGGHKYQPNSSSRAPSALSRGSGGYGDTGSDIYVTSGAYKAPSEMRYDIVKIIIINLLNKNSTAC